MGEITYLLQTKSLEFVLSGSVCTHACRWRYGVAKYRRADDMASSRWVRPGSVIGPHLL